MADTYLSVGATLVSDKRGKLSVRAEAEDSCGSCAQQGGCSISRVVRRRNVNIPLALAAGHGACQETTVELTVTAGSIVRAALVCYLLPAIGMLVGAALGDLAVAGAGDIPALVGCGAGLTVGCWLQRLYHARVSDPAGRAVARLSSDAAAIRVVLD